MILIFVIIAGLIALYLQTSERRVEPQKEISEFRIDTKIPKGFTLIPIEIINYESLDSIIGTFSVVDLYSVPMDPKKRAKKMASKVKLFRSPKNPSHFAILVNTTRAGKVLKSGGPYSVTIRNPNIKDGTIFEKPKPRKASRLVFISE